MVFPQTETYIIAMQNLLEHYLFFRELLHLLVDLFHLLQLLQQIVLIFH
jgi:hypothetical protein